MYIEIEPALTAALIQDHDLINEALKHNIIIATPTTLIALLQTIAYGWRQYQMSENAQQILKEAQEFYSRTTIFTEHFDKLGKPIRVHIIFVNNSEKLSIYHNSQYLTRMQLASNH